MGYAIRADAHLSISGQHGFELLGKPLGDDPRTLVGYVVVVDEELFVVVSGVEHVAQVGYGE